MIELKEVTMNTEGYCCTQWYQPSDRTGRVRIRSWRQRFRKVHVDTSSDEGDRTNVRYDYCQRSESESYETSPDSAVQKRNRRCIPGFQTSERPQYL